MGQLYVLVHHDLTLERIQESDAEEIIVGRQENCGIPLTDDSVSRTHAMIFQRDGEFLIRDLGSRNGTWLNGCRITGDEVLRQRAEVMICGYRLVIWFDLSDVIRQIASNDETTCDDDRLSPGKVVQLESLLTAAQSRVYKLLLEGLSEKEVAARLGISINTVHDHTKAIYKTLAVSSRGELFVKSRRGEVQA